MNRRRSTSGRRRCDATRRATGKQVIKKRKQVPLRSDIAWSAPDRIGSCREKDGAGLRTRFADQCHRSDLLRRAAVASMPWPWCDGEPWVWSDYPRGESQAQWHWKSGIARMRKRAPICVASYGGETDRASPRSVWTRSAAAHQRCFHNWPLASFAPSTSALNLAQTIEGCTSFDPANEAKPQSALAMTRSRPTTPAKRMRR